MGMSQIAAVAAFLVLLQFDVYQARSCNYRSTVVQIRIPGKTNVTLRYPPKVDPVTFNPYPGKLVPECYICSGSSCKKCTQSDLNKTSPPSGSAPVRTNIIIDLKREKPKASEHDPGKPDKPSGSGDQTPTKDETFVVVQDTATATGTGKSVAIEKNANGGESVASSATSVAATNSEVIGAFQQDSPTGETAKTNIENIYVESDSKSTADTTAISGVSSDPVKPHPQAPPPAALPSPPPEVSQPNPVEQPAVLPAPNKNEKDEALAASASKAEADVKNTKNGLENASADAGSAAKAIAKNNDSSPNEEKEKAIAASAADAAASVTNDGATPAKEVAVAAADSKAVAT